MSLTFRANPLYYMVNSVFIAVLVWMLILLVKWFTGDQISPIMGMNCMVIFAYSLCMVAFNSPDSKRMGQLRNFGLLYCTVMLLISLLMVNDIISFKDSWNYVIAGMSISLLLASIFQIYKMRSFDKGLKKTLKYGMMGLTVVVFVTIGGLYIMAPDSKHLYTTLEYVLAVYSVLMIVYFGWAMVTSKGGRSMPNE